MNTVELDIADHVGWLTLHGPQSCNAIDQDMLRGLDQALTQAEHSDRDVRALVLQGAGKHFCSGIDLRSMQTPRLGRQDIQPLMARSFLDHIIERLLNLRLPIVAALWGVTAGAGMTLALTADVIVMSEDACLLPSFTNLGLVPDSGITHLLAERVGASRARAALMLSDRIDARTAKEWGLAYEVTSPEDLQSKAGEFAARLASGPPGVLAATRSLLHRPEPRGFRKQLEAERTAHAQALLDREYVEGFAAFFERRKPKF